MDGLEMLRGRVSIGRLVDPAPSDSALEQAFAAADRAPDHGRLRPWRFFTIAGDARARFGRLLAEALLARDPTATADLAEREAGKALRAPLLIVAATRVVAHPKVPEIEQILATGAAVQNLMLAFHGLGYGAVWKTGPAAYDPTIKAAFGLTPADAIVAIIYVGTPDERPSPPPAGERRWSVWPG